MNLRYCFLVLLFASFACKDDVTTNPTGVPADLFAVHLWSGFSMTPVSVSVDQREVFADTVSTSMLLGVAAIIPVPVNRGRHTLSVAIPSRVSKDTFFVIEDTLFAGVDYDSSRSSINCYFGKNLFGYR